MSFKEQLDELKSAHKAGLLDENAFRRAKQQLFTELKTGVFAPESNPALPAEQYSPARTSNVAEKVAETDAADQEDMSFKERLDQLKVAYRMGMMDEMTFTHAKQELFTELKTGVIKSADAVSVSDSKHAVTVPNTLPLSPTAIADDPHLPIHNHSAQRSRIMRSVFSSVLMIGLACFGLYYFKWSRESTATAPPPAQVLAQAQNGLGTPHIPTLTAAEAKSLQRQAADNLGLPVTFQDDLVNGSQGPQMMVIPAGEFVMGANPEQGGKADERVHRVTFPQAFAISRYPIQFREYERFAAARSKTIPDDQGWGRGQRPVIDVNWRDAYDYAAWLAAQTGQKYRLPTEAEWEYAARAGTNTAFHFGPRINTKQANFDGRHANNEGMPGRYLGRTFPVGQFPANAWGLHDVHGNVWSWTCSPYDSAYGGDEQRCAIALDTKPRAVRGGAWSSGPEALRSAARFNLNPNLRLNVVGFRVVREL